MAQKRWPATRVAAKIIARLFDPVIEIPVILFSVAGYAYLNGYRWKLLTALFVFDALIPGLYYLWTVRHLPLKLWELPKNGMRVPLFTLTIISHGVGVAIAYLLGRRPLADELLALWVVALVFSLITVWWKISIHAGVNAVLVTLLMYYFGPAYGWVWLVVLMVAWARVVDKDHSVAQVIAGSIIPPLILIWFLP